MGKSIEDIEVFRALYIQTLDLSEEDCKKNGPLGMDLNYFRKVMFEHNVCRSRTTVANLYEMLEIQGFIEKTYGGTKYKTGFNIIKMLAKY